MCDLWWTKCRSGRVSPSTSVSPTNSHSTKCSILIYHPGLLVANVPSGLSLIPPHSWEELWYLSIVIRLRLNNWRIDSWPKEDIFSVLRSVQTCLRHPPSGLLGKRTSNLHLLPKLRISKTVPPLPHTSLLRDT
jgi:hypothetical protein